MNISKYIGKTFPAGKTAKELGIDTTRKFVVVVGCYSVTKEGTVVSFVDGWEDHHPRFKVESVVSESLGKYLGSKFYLELSDLAYLEEEDEKTDYHKNMQNYYDNKVAEYLADTFESYVPCAEDRVRLEEDEKIEYTVDPEKDVDTTDFLSGMNYIPRLGDKVRKDGVITSVCGNGGCAVGFSDDTEVWFDPKETSDLTLISRLPRTLTKAEAEKMLSEKLGEDITIE